MGLASMQQGFMSLAMEHREAQLHTALVVVVAVAVGR